MSVCFLMVETRSPDEEVPDNDGFADETRGVILIIRLWLSAGEQNSVICCRSGMDFQR